MKRINLGAKLLSGGLLILVIPIILIGIVSVFVSSSRISTIAKNDMSIIAEGLAETVGICMNEQIITIKNVASAQSIIFVMEKMTREGEKNSRNEIAAAESELIKIKENEGDRCSSVNLIGLNGVIFASSNRKANVGVDVTGRDYLVAALKGTPNAGSVVVSKASGRIVMSIASPIYGSTGKAITGIAMIAMEIKYLTDLIDKVKIGKTGYSTIADKTGLTIAHPIKENILKEKVSEVEGMEAVAKMIGQRKSGIVEYKRFGVAKEAYIAFEPITGWSILTTIEIEELYEPASYIRNMIIVIGLISLALATVLLYLFSRSLTKPLINVVEAAQGIASGDLAVKITSESRKDEIGSLSRAFILMIRSLKAMALVAEKIALGDLTVNVTPLSESDTSGNAFATMVEKLRSHMNGIIEGSTVLASAASEILTATTQVVSSTAETAAAISQTTVTVEEVRQAARLSAEKAKNVSSNAQRVTQVSQSGQMAVEETAAGMLHIREQMESISQTIIRLSEQSLSIGGIIASVSELADQSNLLAVNAAIEAARAGEHGKGFAVVAQEIKSLSEQSKKATAQIRGILGDVQKATSTAVMAAEQGSRAVESGVKQSAQAGEAIRALADYSGEAAQAASQIVASSQQQVVGMDQIGIAMENINQAGAQTVASMRQAETAAQNLHELGQRLKGLVDKYKT